MMQKYETPRKKVILTQKPKRTRKSIERESIQRESIQQESCPKCGSPVESRRIWTSPGGIEISMCTVCKFYTKSLPRLKD